MMPYECAWFNSIDGHWVVGWGGLDEYGHPRFDRPATAEEAVELEEAAEFLHQEYLALEGVA
jgi:hypothetical protein